MWTLGRIRLSRWDPPVAVAEQFHRGGHEQHSYDGGVDRHGDGEAEAEQFEDPVGFADDAAENDD